MSFDYRALFMINRLDWWAIHRFGIYQYGCCRYVRLFKLGIRLWEIK